MNIKQLISKVETDVSGKWISVSEAEKLAVIAIEEFADYISLNLNDDRAKDLVIKYFKK